MNNERAKELAHNISLLCDGFDNMAVAAACAMIAGLAIKDMPAAVQDQAFQDAVEILQRIKSQT
jgi:hypothetical protein